MGAGPIDIASTPEEPPNQEAGEGAFAHLLTPAELRFVRCNFPVPSLGPEHAVELCGAVAAPRIVSLAELRSLPQIALTAVTECAGNGRWRMRPPVDGTPWNDGAVSAAQWTGVPLCAVLQLNDSAVEVVFTGADGGKFQRSLPREVALDPSTLLAFEMNGAPIPPRFGGPLRLVVPGWYGMASVKWLARIEAVERPFRGEFQTEKYVYAPGAPVTRMRIKSMFTHVAPGRIAGLAWGGAGVARVEVWTGGEWRRAQLVGPALPHAWRRWELRWTPPRRGTCLLRCRATDAAGETQPDEPQWNPLGYGANPVQELQVQCARMLLAVSR